jgi:MFS family permease
VPRAGELTAPPWVRLSTLGAQFAGRLLGDRFIDRVGNRPALVTSLGLVSAGLLLAAWAPGLPLTLAGLALAGLGCAITVPLAFAGADALPGLRPHAGVTWISWVMRAATIGLSPAIGGIAMVASLPLAMSLVSLLAVVALCRVVLQRREWGWLAGGAGRNETVVSSARGRPR